MNPSDGRKSSLDNANIPTYSPTPQEEPEPITQANGSVDNGTKKENCVVSINDEVRKLFDVDSPASNEFTYQDSHDSLPTERNNIDVFKEKLKTDFLGYIKSNISSQQYLLDIEEGIVQPDDVSSLCDKLTHLEKNILLLWAAYHGKNELFSEFINCGSDINCCDVNGFTPLHLCAYTGNVEGCAFFLSQGVNVNLIPDKYTPLHCAALGDAPETLKLLLINEAKIEYYKDGVIGDGTALHAAIKVNSLDCLRLLIKECADINSLDPGGWAPIHTVADLGRDECLELLLHIEGIKINIKTRDKDSTPLHLAAKHGHTECVSLLISKGANPQEVNYYGQSPLHLAAHSESPECVEMLLASKECDVNAVDDEQRTPLHAAVTKGGFPDVVRALIRHQAQIDARDKYGCTPLHIAALHEEYDCIEVLLEHDADVGACTNAGITALSIIGRKIPAAIDLFEKKLDGSITVHDPKASHQDVELKLDFHPFLQHSTQGEIDFLKIFIDEKQKEILEHPLCQAFIYLKWRKIRKYYTARLIMWFLLVIIFTSYTYSMAHSCPREVTVKPIIWDPFIIHQDAISPQWYILLLITLIETFRKIYSISSYTGIRQYVKIPENIMEWYVILASYVMMFSYTYCIAPWQEGVGGIGILLAWTNMMFKVGQLPFFESYVTMFLKVQKDFIKLFLAYSCLLIGFTTCFCIILPTADEFTYPHVGFLKTLVMMTGELNLINFLTIERAGNNVLFIILFPIFVLFVTIVLMNLLVGIAVHDIQGLQKTAKRSKLERQVRLVSHIESSLFNIRFHLPQYFMHMLRDTALLSSASNRVTIHVRPHNPRERRLPRELLESLYKLYQQKKRSQRSIPTPSKRPTGRLNFRSRDGKTDADVCKTMQDLTFKFETVSQSNKQLTKEVTELKRILTKFIKDSSSRRWKP